MFYLQHESAVKDNYRLSSLGPRKKKPKVQRNRLTPLLSGLLVIKKGTPVAKPIRILCDSGASTSLLAYSFAKKLRKKRDTETTWETGGGEVKTSKMCKIQFQLPEILPTMTIVTDVHLTKHLGKCYDMILG